MFALLAQTAMIALRTVAQDDPLYVRDRAQLRHFIHAHRNAEGRLDRPNESDMLERVP